jgi:cellulose synthase/poly-beta-1,6-N-acetylglucosamine synthase-like glycosyltransferase
MIAFYFLAAVLIWLGALSLRGGLKYLAYVRREMSGAKQRYAPYASLMAPCRGLDQGLSENVSALFMQNYPRYEIIFVTDSALDPALAVIENVCAEQRKLKANVSTRIVVAGKTIDRGQKVHNLRAAISHVHQASEVFAFVDTDARPGADWLKALIAPLANKQVGAATGYRWFIPVKGNLASRLRAVWNASIASALGENGWKNFCWGGAMAVRRATFEELNVLEEWCGTLSDDFALMRAIKRARLWIHFVPECLTASHEDCTFRELLEFTTRQLKITRVYAPEFWRAVLSGSFIFVCGFFGGIILTLVRAALGFSFIAPLILLTIVFALGASKAYVRWRAVTLALAQQQDMPCRDLFAQLFLWPLASVLYLYNALCALFSRRIEWRGISYELKSPTETVIISQRPAEAKTESGSRITRRA